MVTGFSEVGGGGIEPPTPGFSIVVSETAEDTVTTDFEREYDNGSISAAVDVQQIAQHFSTNPADLLLLIKHWPSLSDDTQKEILKLVHNDISVSRTS